MNYEYYIIKFKFNEASYYTIWHELDSKFLLESNENKIKVFETKEEIFEYVNKLEIKVDEEESEYICQENILIENEIIDCNKVLNFWNIADDVATTLGLHFTGNDKTDDINRIYDKLFYGCNLPAIKGEHEDYIPIWSQEESMMIKKIVQEGIELIEGNICNM